MAKKAPKSDISQTKKTTFQNAIRGKFCLRPSAKKYLQKAWQKLSDFSWHKTADYGRRIWHKIGHLTQFISDAWKSLLYCSLTFLVVYYLLGSKISEKIDTSRVYTIPKDVSEISQTADCAAFLIRREVDDKMWTANLPFIFPAAILDNMPNFQIGIISAARDVNAALKQIQNISETQREDLLKAHKLLSYSPYVWLQSKQDGFGLAPSANTQYRKAAKSLNKFNLRQKFVPSSADLPKILTVLSRKLKKNIAKSESYWREHVGDWFDCKADDVFYYNRGYAFALWQMCKALGNDYKKAILVANAYEDWTYLLSSLQQAAEFSPFYVRNGNPQSLTAPNHLLAQNYFLARALSALEKICNLTEDTADAD